MSTPIKISLLKPNYPQISSGKKNQKLNPIVLLKRLPVSKVFTEQFLSPKKSLSNHQVSSSQREPEIEVYECLFCIEIQSFESVALLNDHMTIFHRILINHPIVIPKKVVRSSQRRTEVPGQTAIPNDSLNPNPQATNPYNLSPTKHPSPDDSSNPQHQNPVQTTNPSPTKHQCYICSLEFYQQTVLSLHLEEVHHVQDYQKEKIAKVDCPLLPNLEISLLELKDNVESTGEQFKAELPHSFSAV